jgi:7,8-dihydropterin-6-yl-methyl-4-(beta-D-ribofuranosyl)aminobenzene 5'-phosphate synthase
MCDDHGHVHVPPVEAVPADAGWAGEVLPLEPVDAVTVLTVCDNSVDMLLVDQGPAKRIGLGSALGGAVPRLDAPTMEGRVAIDALQAEHGFSALVEVRKGDTVRRLLFDTGLTPTGCAENLRRLGRDPGDIEVIVCSHGHFDHTTGLSGLVARLGRTNLPVIIHPEFWSRRRIVFPGAEPFELPTTSRRALEGAGFEIVEERRPSFLFDRSVLITGEVDRTTPFEHGMPFHEAHRDGAWVPDPLVLDDQAMVVDVAGRGLVVVTGCGHAGVVNVCHYARRLTGVDAVHAVMGGFHLSGPAFEPIIGDTVEALARLAPDVVVPAHCTGWRATQAIAGRLPDAFVPNSVGTSFELVGAGAA